MANKALTKIDQFQLDLANNSKAISSMLPPHVSLKKFQRITFIAVQRNQDLIGKPGLIEAVMDCAKDGLVPDNKEAALTVFKGKAVYMPMVRGITKMVRQSGELKSLTANVIVTGDEFKSWTDENGPHFMHNPDLLNESTEIIGAYAVAVTKDGGSYFEVLKKADIEKIKNSAPAQNGPWKTWPEEMAKKSAIRRLSKRLPMSTDLEDAIYRDNEVFYDSAPAEPAKDVTPQKGTSAEDLGDKLPDKKKPEVKPEPEPENEPVQVGQADSRIEIF